MALIICKECGKQISDSAKFCPYCGYRGIRKNGGGFGVASLVMGILAGTYALTSCISNYFSPQSTVYAMIWTLILGFLSVIFGLVSLKKRGITKNPLAGIVIGTVAMLVSIIFTAFV